MTTDLWTEERTNTHYITVTVHYILGWKLLNRVLATREIMGVKTHDNIRRTVLQVCFFFFTPSLLLCYICVVHILNVVIFYLFVQVISYYSIQCLLYFLLTVLTSSSFNDNNNFNNNNSTIIYLQSNHYGLFICFWINLLCLCCFFFVHFFI